ncbi:hypothetical protein OT109_06225 [Phycisphaeraceae bacterium D3-23]
MKCHPPAAPDPARRRRAGRSLPALLALTLLLGGAPLTGCVELSRTEKGRFGNPLQNHSAGSRTEFDADNYKPPTVAQKPWYQRLFDW